MQIQSVFLVWNTSFSCVAKIIRKVNDNDDGRVVMQARTVTAVDPFAFRPSAIFWLMRAVLYPVFICALSKCSVARSVCGGADSVCS